MTKRIVSLLIAVMLVVGIFAIPAAANTLSLGNTPCDNCGMDCFTAYGPWYTVSNTGRIDGCGYKSGPHVHVNQNRNITVMCTVCGHINSITRDKGRTICPYGPEA